MNWRNWWNRAKGAPAAHENELDEEFAFHADMKARELTGRDGLSEEQARREARRSLGNLTLAREDAREAWSFPWLAGALRDLRYGARSLAAQPGFTLAAVLALVLGIGVNAVLFNVYNALALAPYAIRDAASTVSVMSDRRGNWSGFSWPEYRYLREHTRALSAMTAATGTGVRITRGGAAWAGQASSVSENFFDAIGTGFAAGRGFSSEAGRLRDPAPEVVLHYDTWAARMGSDPNVLGEWLEINGHKLRVVGIAARGFAGPEPVPPTLWIPGPWRDIFEPGQHTIDTPDSCCVSVIGRLKPGVSRGQAEAELAGLSAQYRKSVGQEASGARLATPTLLAGSKASRAALPLFLALAVTVSLILLLACANVANLQIARAAARRREIAVRLALGAGRGRLLRQLAMESLLLASIAGLAGVAIAAWAPGRIVSYIAAESRGLAIRFDNDYRVIAFILLVTLAAALLSGFAPAWTAVREAAAAGMREGGGRGATVSSGRLRRVLLAVQVGLGATLVSGTTLLVRVAEHARHIDPGFSYENSILLAPGLASGGVTNEQSGLLLDALAERVRALPGVERVAHGVAVPLGNTNMRMGVRDARGGELALGFDRVSAGYFETMGIPILTGTAFQPGDETREVAVVNQAAAERLWPAGVSPLGKPLTATSKAIVIGIAANVTTRQFGSELEPHAWQAVRPGRESKLIVRHAPGAAQALLGTLPALARQQDSRFLATAAPYTEIVANGRRAADLAAGIAAVLGSLALLLAAVGIYGVAAYNVSQRTREIGVRMALGARPAGILSMMLGQNLRTVAIGAAVGVAGAIGFGQLLKSLLYGLSPADPWALALSLAILAATALLATWLPARRAASIDPCITLRED